MQWLRWSAAGQIDWPKFIFLQNNEATHFKAMMTTVNEDNNDKAKVPDEFNYHRVSPVCILKIDE